MLQSTNPEYEVVCRSTITRRQMYQLFVDWSKRLFTNSIYLTPEALQTLSDHHQEPIRHLIRSMPKGITLSETGAVIFASAHDVVAIAPPFPVKQSMVFENYDHSELRRILETKLTVGIILLRLGRYAVGVLEGDRLIASKTDSRYVKNRHRAGGSSQRRFMRSRERLIRELYDKTCDVTRSLLEPHENSLDYVLLGGEQQTITGFVKRCDFIRRMRTPRLNRLLEVGSPNQKSLDAIVTQVWCSRMITLQRVPPSRHSSLTNT